MTTVDHAELDVSITGEGPTRVRLHGMSSSRAHEAAAGILVEVSGRVVAYDARGHGRSTGRPEPDDYRWPHLATDLFAVLDEHVTGASAGPVDGIGASMGTATLLHAAVREPHRFRRLVLTIPPTAWESRAAQGDGYRQMADVVDREGVAGLAVMMQDAPVPPALGDREPPPPDVTDELFPAVLRGAAATDLPDPEALRDLRLSVLLVPWADDPGHPVSTSERLLDLLPDARLHLVSTPDDLAARNDVIEDFLS